MPTQGRYKIYLIDEVHMLSTHSFNALLKTLEEPPEHVKFILATTDPQKIPSTILSRCLHFSLNRISSEVIKNQLEKVLEKEKINFEESAIKNISKIADGSMRDALSITEQCISHGDNKITYDNICKILCLMPVENINKVIDYIVKEEADGLIEFIDKMYYQSVDFKYLLQEIISIFHQTAIFKVTKKSNDSMYESSIKNLSDKYSEEEIQILYQIGVSNLKDLEFAPDFKSGFEMAIIRLLLFTPFNLEKLQSCESISNKSNKQPSKENIVKKESASKNIVSEKKKFEG
jgi:DNA polymerase-3 subunit gamma/tau